MEKARIVDIGEFKGQFEGNPIANEHRKKIISLKYAVKKKARRELNGALFKLYDAIFDKCRGDSLSCWPLTKTLAEELGICVGTCRNLLYELQKSCFIFRQINSNFTYQKNGKVYPIKNARLITLILSPERFKKMSDNRKREAINKIVERFIKGELTWEQYKHELNKLGYFDRGHLYD